MPTTIKDIARVVGVSPTAVSRALNNHRDISEETRRKILKAAEELDYHPNAIARSLVNNKSGTIGLFALGRSGHGFYHPFSFEVISGVLDTLSAAGYDVVLFGADTGGPYLARCRERRVEGAVFMGLRTDDPELSRLQKSRLPCVLIDFQLSGQHLSYVGSDNTAGAETAVEHLINLGHSRIGFINGHEFATVSRERLEGYRRALEKRHIPFEPALVFPGDFSRESGHAAVDYFFSGQGRQGREEKPVTAIFAASDFMAISAMEALKQRGIRVPEDVEIIGFDDIDLAAHVNPPLSTVRQDKYMLGATAGRTLMGMIAGAGSPPVKVLLGTELVIRGTCRNC